jgi:hypothetical protein
MTTPQPRADVSEKTKAKLNTLARSSTFGVGDGKRMIAALRIAVAANSKYHGLVEEVMQSHADPDGPNYNECDQGRMCQWCVDANLANKSERAIAQALEGKEREECLGGTNPPVFPQTLTEHPKRRKEGKP